MRTGLGAAMAVTGIALGLPASSGAQPTQPSNAIEPVVLTVSAPGSVTVGAPLAVTVAVSAQPGALDIRTAPLRMAVRLATGECGGDYAGTTGPTVIDAQLSPQPSTGQSYEASANGQLVAQVSGTLTVCAFLQEEGDERQFATETETQIAVLAAGAAAGPGGSSTKTASGSPGAGSLLAGQCVLAKRRALRERRLLTIARRELAHAKGLRKRRTARRRVRRDAAILTRERHRQTLACPKPRHVTKKKHVKKKKHHHTARKHHHARKRPTA